MKNNILDSLINAFTCLPGVGNKTAKRMTYYLLQRAKDDALNLSNSLKEAVENTRNCKNCRNLCFEDLCTICSDNSRELNKICIVENSSDVSTIEDNTEYKGLYYVLHGKLSPLDDIGPKEIGLDFLENKLLSENIEEIILAVNYTIESDVTAHVISEIASNNNIKVTRLAQGVPVGGELEYLDKNTLLAAFNKRTNY
ncbi:MAG: recombination mediator RecR [Pseudomonadota bacterium]|nr:recombination mediator RecR [Pseudomonadota bacterium]